ncbi:two-component system, OmpR family, phosphate regulon sensor histidine kinase PhoR [Prosthecobacter debontii]|uniref:histidine kinase n=1 Tax=Prosthecobacter debontii TaxID=48467 RepID=A0A1T4YQV0_9BACT|nr:ATP-binding protein [Prosthecobacter debontii]SKB04106.1 two-component system, OmpR family, phosphate regulon sensor histidine kinase PhoR [Prosthecobacter debontii]
MTVTILVVALVLLALFAWRRELHWRQSVLKITKAAGLRDFEADKLGAKFAGLIEAETALHKEEYLRRLFESLLNEIRQGVVITDDHQRIKFCNRTMGHLFHRPSIHRGRTLLEEFSDHEINDIVQAALLNQRRTVKEIELNTPLAAGMVSSRHYLIEAAPLPAKAEAGAWLMVYDITEQTMAEQVRKDFVANASHELRTPLTLINGYIETLQSGVIKDDAAMKRCLDVMEKHGKRIIRIIEDMLTISRLENGSSALNLEPFTARSCVQDALDHLAPMLEGRDTRFQLDFPSDGGHMVGDRFYWDQVFTNLLENAIKENPNPGLMIKVTGQWFADHCVIRVSDNGIGIPAHDLPFVFKRFFRGHKHHSPEIKGTGLGLSIVRRTIEAHGGTIELTSTPGVETTFTIRVPLTGTAVN